MSINEIIITPPEQKWDQVYQLISWWKPEKVLPAKVMVVGAGALGNEVLKNLALLGVGNILIIDFDQVEYSNLSRSVLYRQKDVDAHRLKCEVAAERVKELNPNVKVQYIAANINTQIGLGVFRRMDAIIGCLDNRMARLSINRNAFKVNKHWVDGAIENMEGQATVYHPNGGCYECELTEVEKEILKRARGCFDVAMRNQKAGRIPTTPLSASIIGAVQTQEALKIIHGYDDNLLNGRMFRYEGMYMEVGVYNSEKTNEDCNSHYHYTEIIEETELSANMTVESLLKFLTKKYGNESFVKLDQRFIFELFIEAEKREISVQIPDDQLNNFISKNNLRGGKDEEVRVTKVLEDNVLDENFPFKNLTLLQIGIPLLHIIRVIDTNKNELYIELTGDAGFLNFK